jgi:hypothetical protein
VEGRTDSGLIIRTARELGSVISAVQVMVPELVKRVKGVQFREAAKMIEGVAGKVGVRQSWAPKSSTRDELNMLWKRAQAPHSDLHGRPLFDAPLRFIPDSQVMREDGNEMLAIVSGHNVDERNGVTLHRTHDWVWG